MTDFVNERGEFIREAISCLRAAVPCLRTLLSKEQLRTGTIYAESPEAWKLSELIVMIERILPPLEPLVPDED